MSNNLPVGVLKGTPESFVVKEIIRGNPPQAVEFYDESFIWEWDRELPVTIFALSKRRWNTADAVEEAARQLDVSVKDISFYGLKDKHARTSQHIGVQGNFRPSFSHPEISLAQQGGQRFPLRIGDIVGNRFEIFIASTADDLDFAAARAVPNFFGPQRLGRPGAEEIGRFLLEGDYDEAIRLIRLNPESEKKLFRAKELVGGSWFEALFHPSFEFSFNFEVHKWQSHLWNKLLQEKKEKLGNSLPDRLLMWNTSQEVSEMYQHLWAPTQLDSKVVNALQIHPRPTMLRPKDFKYERKTTGWKFNFDLPPGAYATTVLAQLFKLEERHYE